MTDLPQEPAQPTENENEHALGLGLAFKNPSIPDILYSLASNVANHARALMIPPMLLRDTGNGASRAERDVLVGTLTRLGPTRGAHLATPAEENLIATVCDLALKHELEDYTFSTDRLHQLREAAAEAPSTSKQMLIVQDGWLEELAASLTARTNHAQGQWELRPIHMKPFAQDHARLIAAVFDAADSLPGHAPSDPVDSMQLIRAPWSEDMRHGAFDAGTQRIEVVEGEKRIRPERATVLYFGGRAPVSEEDAMIQQAVSRLRRTLDPEQIPPESYDLFIASYNNGASTRKLQYSLDYAAAPETFHSPHAREVVEWILPFIARENGGEWQRLDTPEMERNLSLLTLAGYSYGTCFVQEFRNALHARMETLGYAPQEISDGLARVAAVNLGPVVRVQPHASGDFTQLFLGAREDGSVQTHSNMEQLTRHDANPHVGRHFTAGERGLSTAVLLGRNVPDTLDSYMLEPLEAEGERIPGAFIARSKERGASYVEQPNGHRHHLDGYLRQTRVRRDDGRLTIAANMGTYALRAFFQASVRAATDVAEGKATTRESQAILQSVADRELTDAMLAQRHRTARDMERTMPGIIASDSQLPPLR